LPGITKRKDLTDCNLLRVKRPAQLVTPRSEQIAKAVVTFLCVIVYKPILPVNLKGWHIYLPQNQ
jgi:hypothetical protein